MGAGAQAAAAVVMVGALAVGLWGLQKALPQQSPGDEPATCSTSTPNSGTSKRVSGAQLCKALNRPDLATLLGTPAEHAETAGGGDSYVTLADGTKIATPDANITLKTYSVRLSASYDDLPVAEMADLLGNSAETFLGRPAVLYL